MAERGNRPYMEDTYLTCHDLMIDDYIKASIFSVIDGHGGDHCAHYIKSHLIHELRKNITNNDSGIRSNK